MKALMRTLLDDGADVYPASAFWPRRFAERGVGRFPLRAYVRAAWILSALFTVGMGGLLLAASHPGEAHDPFAAYSSIMPGHERMDALRQGAVCTVTHDMTRDETCVLTPADGPFKTVSIAILKGQIIAANFTVRANTLFAGDLESLWGKPIVYSNPNDNRLLLQWSAYHISATVTQASPNSYSVSFLSVNHIISYQ